VLTSSTLCPYTTPSDLRKGKRIRECKRSTGENKRMTFVSVTRKRRDAGEFEGADHPGDFELVGDRDGDHRIVADRTHRFVGEKRGSRLGKGFDIVGQKGAMRDAAGALVDEAVDRLKSEGAHPRVVGSRIEQ